MITHDKQFRTEGGAKEQVRLFPGYDFVPNMRFMEEAPKKRLQFRALRGKTPAVEKRIASASCDLEVALGTRVCVQALCA